MKVTGVNFFLKHNVYITSHWKFTLSITDNRIFRARSGVDIWALRVCWNITEPINSRAVSVGLWFSVQTEWRWWSTANEPPTCAGDSSHKLIANIDSVQNAWLLIVSIAVQTARRRRRKSLQQSGQWLPVAAFCGFDHQRLSDLRLGVAKQRCTEHKSSTLLYHRNCCCNCAVICAGTDSYITLLSRKRLRLSAECCKSLRNENQFHPYILPSIYKLTRDVQLFYILHSQSTCK